MPSTPLSPAAPEPVSAAGLRYRVRHVPAPGRDLPDSYRCEWTSSPEPQPEPWQWQSVRDHGTREDAEAELAERLREDAIGARVRELRAEGYGRGLSSWLRDRALRARAEELLAAEPPLPLLGEAA